VAAPNSSSFLSSSPPSEHKRDTIRVFVADGTLMGNQLLAAALSKDRRFDVAGTAETSEQVLAALRNAVDIVIISAGIEERHSAGFHLTRRVRAAHPGIRVIMLLDRAERDPVVESFRAGATGVFCRGEPLEVLWSCIQSVHQGKIWASNDELKLVIEALTNSNLPRLATADHACSLTPRERKIISLVAEGLTNRQMAAELNLSEHTIKNYLLRMFEKFEVSTRVELVFTALGHPDWGTSELTNPEGKPVNGGSCKADDYLWPFAQLKAGGMQFDGSGKTNDLVSAHMWFSLSEETAKIIIDASRSCRQSLHARMTAVEIAEAGRRASDWLRQHQQQLRLLVQRGSGTNRRADQVGKSNSPPNGRLIVA